MAYEYNETTKYLTDTASKLTKSAKLKLGLYGTALIIFIAVYFMFIAAEILNFIILLAICAGAFLFLRRTYESELRKSQNYLDGFQGEEALRNELRKLPENYAIFSDLQLPNRRANIDLVLTGPAGIFMIEAKFYKNADIRSYGTALYDRKWKLDHAIVRHCLSQMEALNKYFLTTIHDKPTSLRNLLVFAHPNSKVKHNTEVQGIKVLHVTELVNFIQSQPYWNQNNWMEFENALHQLSITKRFVPK